MNINLKIFPKERESSYFWVNFIPRFVLLSGAEWTEYHFVHTENRLGPRRTWIPCIPIPEFSQKIVPLVTEIILWKEQDKTWFDYSEVVWFDYLELISYPDVFSLDLENPACTIQVVSKFFLLQIKYRWVTLYRRPTR